MLGIDHDMLRVVTQDELFDADVKILEIVRVDDHTNKKKPLPVRCNQAMKTALMRHTLPLKNEVAGSRLLTILCAIIALDI